ncbi:MAG: hypothetical protein IJE62_03675 [Clostridia bacterium]|nr:hypothetical protein [Clostridia bacterium]
MLKTWDASVDAEVIIAFGLLYSLLSSAAAVAAAQIARAAAICLHLVTTAAVANS